MLAEFRLAKDRFMRDLDEAQKQELVEFERRQKEKKKSRVVMVCEDVGYIFVYVITTSLREDRKSTMEDPKGRCRRTLFSFQIILDLRI